MPSPSEADERRHPQDPQPARAPSSGASRSPAAAARGRRGASCDSWAWAMSVMAASRLVRVLERDSARAGRACQRGSWFRSSAASRRAGSPGAMYAFGSTIDSLDERLERLAGRFAAALQSRRGRARPSRSRPGSALNVWQAPQPFVVKIATAGSPPPPPPPLGGGGLPELLYHFVIRGLRHHDRLAAHQRMAETAELGADHRVGAEPRSA